MLGAGGGTEVLLEDHQNDRADQFAECSPVMSSEPIRQGDVFRWLVGDEGVWRQFGVIVTADCDIARDKHAGILTYVPVLRLHEYLARFFVARKVERQVQQLWTQVFRRARELQSAHASAYPIPLSEQAVAEWIPREGPESVADALGAPDDKDRNRFVDTARDWQLADEAVRSECLTEQVDALVALRPSGQLAEKTLERLEADVSSHVAGLPGDGLFLTSIGPSLRDGFVAYLRRPREVAERSIALRQSQIADASVTAQRISRLGSPYRYRLTQQMAQVFTDIGLPTAYEESRAECVAGVVNGAGTTE